MKFDQIDPNLYEQVESELLAGEELLWIGQPNRLRMLKHCIMKGLFR